MGSPNLFEAEIRAALSRNLATLLRQHQLSENGLARLSGVSQKQVNNIRRQRTGCGVDAVAAIARVFRIPPWQLLTSDLGRGDSAVSVPRTAPEGPILQVPSASPNVLSVTLVRIRLHDNRGFQGTDENNYRAVVIRSRDRVLYRAKGITVPVTEDEAQQVVGNPFLYYFSTALKLHHRIARAMTGRSVDGHVA